VTKRAQPGQSGCHCTGQRAGGVIRYAYDYSSTPPKPVAERLVYRPPVQKLNVRVAEPRRDMRRAKRWI